MKARDLFGLGLGFVFGIAILADIIVPNYDLPAGFIGLMGSLVTAWFAIGVIRGGRND